MRAGFFIEQVLSHAEFLAEVLLPPPLTLPSKFISWTERKIIPTDVNILLQSGKFELKIKREKVSMMFDGIDEVKNVKIGRAHV